jgi:hypothetical protein
MKSVDRSVNSVRVTVAVMMQTKTLVLVALYLIWIHTTTEGSRKC